ncbi:SdpI family protein [Alkalibacter rhizosphaerae]|uniref:SdpI family protein n=1 Tax=Alkalibacter rhizosphaerae TaxID=2815577 RepID=A0A974XI47_9FIRM|nr:SdpI family protein [Alkalibacter rhizosphaerae]QSX09110.1 SdpI family protein [Alkalibacter rhizosphaerae]
MKVFIVVVYLSIPLMMIFFGWKWKRKVPGKINYIYGYRTKRSMASPESWEFAHKYMGKVWAYSGLLLLLATLLFFWAYPLDLDKFGWEYLVFAYLQMIVMILGIWPTERALKKRFDLHGCHTQKKQ